MVKGIVHPQIKIVSFTHSCYVIPNVYDFLSSVEELAFFLFLVKCNV